MSKKRVFNVCIPLERKQKKFFWRVGTIFLNEATEEKRAQINILLNSRTLMEDHYVAFEQKGREGNGERTAEDEFDDIPF